MKKFISMVMAAAMVVSLVPATAFADTGSAKAVAKVIDALDVAKDDSKVLTGKNVELQLKVDKDGSYASGSTAEHELTFTLDGAEFTTANAATIKSNIYVTENKATFTETANKKYEVSDVEDDSFKLTITGVQFKDDDVIGVKLGDNITLDSTSVGKKATISVEGDMVTADDLVFAEVKDTGIKATLKKVAEVAEEETTPLERELKIESNVGKFVGGQQFEIKVSSGFELSFPAQLNGSGYTIEKGSDDDRVIVTVSGTKNQEVTDTITINKADLIIDAADAKVGAVAKLTVKALKDNAEGSKTFKATADAVEAAKVVGDKVTMSVDEDEDLPVIYSGVNTDNYGITDDSDHKALEVTLKESVKEALDTKKPFTLTLPEGVYATDVDVSVDTLGGIAASGDAIENLFKDAYKKGEQETFEFKRNAFTKSNDAFEFSFKMTLIAEPTFEGDVVLTLEGDGFDGKQEVKIAKFVKPYTVEASQNNLIIDYRNTKVPTNVVVKEAEAGLWDKDKMDFIFNIEKDKMDFENDVTFTVDDKSGMEVKAVKGTDMGFKVTDESENTAATVTLSYISLYMARDLAAGAYNLELYTTATQKMLTGDKLFTNDTVKEHENGYYVADYIDMDYSGASTGYNADKWEDKTYTVKEGFVNIVTAGKDKDNTFTTKVVVPVGEKYLIAGEEQVALDVPAYISAEGYTMLPVRAVATALGINNSNVIWNQATKTVTIMYGQRIITMVAGQKVITVNGNTIPASATVQIKDGRTFLPMRDLATALNVADITWDAATKTATMNGNQNK